VFSHTKQGLHLKYPAFGNQTDSNQNTRFYCMTRALDLLLNQQTQKPLTMNFKKITLVLLAASCLKANAQLNYTQVTSSGLMAVTFEIGFTELESADMNGDGKIDLITIGDHGSPNFSATEAGVMVFVNNGNGTSWTLKKTGAFGYGGIATGDVNNDGKIDIGYGMHHNYASTDLGDQLIEVALGNNTAQSWTPYDDSLAINGETYGMFGVDFADVNNDGLLDIGSTSFGCCAGIHVYKNNGNGTWTQSDGATGGNAHNWFKFGDFDNDGNVDIMAAWDAGQVWKNDGTGFFNAMQSGLPNDWWIEYDLADVNKDGAKDVGLVDQNGNMKVYTYNKNLNQWQSISSGLPQTGNMSGISLDDMDMDGFVDVVAWKASNITIYKGNGGSSWMANGTVSINETQLSSLTTGDLDHDGFSDIAYMARANTGDNYLRVYLHSADIPTLDILPAFPNGLECFAPGSVQFISWASSVPLGSTANITIEFSQNGTGGPWTTVASNVPNSGTYQWATPAISSNNCYLRYTINDGSTNKVITSAQAFGIGNCSVATGVSEGIAAASVTATIYPNPVVNEANLHFNLSKESDVSVSIVNLLGEELTVVDNKNFTAGFQNVALPVSELEPGIYFCNITLAKSKQTIKFVVASR